MDKPFGDVVRAEVIPPASTGQPSRFEDSRYCILAVTNARGWAPAHDVRVSIVQLEQPGIDGKPQIKWTGNLPLEWQHQVLFPLTRTLGRDEAIVDLFSVLKDKWLKLQVPISPHDFPVLNRSAVDMTLTVQALATEGKSNALRLHIRRDGKWHDGTMEMGQHLKVGEV